MGSYLILDHRENNTKSISGLMADIIRDIVGPAPECLQGSWALTRESLSKCTIAATSLLDDESKFKLYIEKHKTHYWVTSGNFKENKEKLQWVVNCFAVTLADMTLKDKGLVLAWWE